MFGRDSPRSRTDSNSSDVSTNENGSYSSSSSSSGQASLFKQMVTSQQSARDIVFKSGKLVKQGSTIKNWKERYCMLKKDGLYYHEVTSKGLPGKLKGKISFKEIKGDPTRIHKTTIAIKNKQKQGISIELPERTYQVYSDSELDLNDWFKSIIQVLTMKDEAPSSFASKLSQQGGSTPTTPTSSASGAVKDDIFAVGSAGSSSSYLGSGGGGQSLAGMTPPLGNLLQKRSPGTNSPLSGSFDYTGSPVNFGSFDLKRASSTLSDLTSDDSDSSYSSFPKSDLMYGDFDGDNGRRYTADSDNEVEVSSQAQNDGNGPILSEEDEFNIAMCAAEIFLKKEEDRTPHEQAYIIALRDYRRKLEEHAKRFHARPEYSLAIGTCIFLTPENERTVSEQEYVRDVLSTFSDDLQDSDRYRLLPLRVQSELIRCARAIHEKSERSDEEEHYLRRIEELKRQISRAVIKHGLKVNHTMATLMLKLTTPFDAVAVPHPMQYDDSDAAVQMVREREDEMIDFYSIEDYEFRKHYL